MIKAGTLANVQYLKYYVSLVRNHDTPEACQISLQNSCKTLLKNKINARVNYDPDSKLGTYRRIYPNLDNYVIEPQLILESERMLMKGFALDLAP